MTFCEDGKRKYLHTDKSVVDAVNGIDSITQANWLMKFLHGIMAVCRASMTVSNPDFSIRNILRDSLPEWKPTAIMPIIECMANYSFFFERPIVPQREKELPAYLQYNASTSELAKMTGEIVGYSPRKIDHLMSGYLGTFFGRQIPRAADSIFTDKKLDMSLSSMPIARRIFFETYKNPKSVSEYYEVKKQQTELHNEYKISGKKPAGYDPALYRRIQANQKAMQNVSKQERAIMDNLKLPVDEQKQRLKELEKKKIEIVKRIMRN